MDSRLRESEKRTGHLYKIVEIKEQLALGQSKLGTSYKTNFGLFTTNSADRADSLEYTQTRGDPVRPGLDRGQGSFDYRPDTNFGQSRDTRQPPGQTINSKMI